MYFNCKKWHLPQFFPVMYLYHYLNYGRNYRPKHVVVNVTNKLIHIHLQRCSTRENQQTELYINMCPIINHNVATSIFMYAHICNRKFYNEYVLSYYVNKSKVTCQITSHKKDVRYALPYCTSCVLQHHKPYPIVCTVFTTEFCQM